MIPPVFTATPSAGPGDLAVAGAAAELGGQLDHLGQPGGARGGARGRPARRSGSRPVRGSRRRVAPASVAGPASPAPKKPSDSRA